jgi:hypothetical protein
MACIKQKMSIQTVIGQGQEGECSYLVLTDETSCSPTQCIANEEIDDIWWEVAHNVVKPNDTSPAPSNAQFAYIVIRVPIYKQDNKAI